MALLTQVMRRRERAFGRVGFTATLLLMAVGVGYFAGRNLPIAMAIAVLPLVTWFVTQRRALALALAAVLPYTTDVSGGATGFNLAPSDLIMVVLVSSLAADWMLARRAPELRPLKPLMIVLATYVGVMLVLMIVHLGLMPAIKTGQRLDIFVFPMIIGVAISRWGDEVKFLGVYSVCATGYGIAWYLFGESLSLGQKNPVGQFVANAIIILIAVKPLRRRFWMLLPLAITALFLTQSRGAILAVGAALAVLLLMQTGLNRVRALIATLPLAAVTWVAFRLLPEDVQTRNTSFSSGTETAADWAVHIRDQYHADAWKIVHLHPWAGLGIGQYKSGNPSAGTFTTDPHQVLLLQAAEGGWPLVIAFIALIAGTALIVWKMAGRTQLGPLAVAVHIAIFSHGLVDVYWVRGTPVLGWLLIGMALNQASRNSLQASTRQHIEPTPEAQPGELVRSP